MYMKPIVEIDITKIIEKFNQNKSAGDDNIGNFIIKRAAKEIVKPLTQIFNLSILIGNVPEKLKNSQGYTDLRKARRWNLELSPSVSSTLFFKDFRTTCI